MAQVGEDLAAGDPGHADALAIVAEDLYLTILAAGAFSGGLQFGVVHAVVPPVAKARGVHRPDAKLLRRGDEREQPADPVDPNQVLTGIRLPALLVPVVLVALDGL